MSERSYVFIAYVCRDGSQFCWHTMLAMNSYLNFNLVLRCKAVSEKVMFVRLELTELPSFVWPLVNV